MSYLQQLINLSNIFSILSNNRINTNSVLHILQLANGNPQIFILRNGGVLLPAELLIVNLAFNQLPKIK